MPNEYASHADYMGRVAESANARTKVIDTALREALKKFIVRQQCDYIDFSKLSTGHLAEAIQQRPEILKPLLVMCNVAGRALARDLKLQVNTYRPRLKPASARRIAEYIKPFLPKTVPIEGVVLIDKSQVQGILPCWKIRRGGVLPVGCPGTLQKPPRVEEH